MLSSRIFIPKKELLRRRSKTARSKILKSRFLDTEQKHAAFDYRVFWVLCLASERSRADLTTQVHLIPKTLFLGPHAISLAQNWTAEIKNTSSVTIFSKVSKKLYFEVFGRALSNCGTQTSLFKDKNPWKKYVIGFEFLQWPNVNSDIAVPIENMNNDVSHAMCERHPFFTSGTKSPKKRRVFFTLLIVVLFKFNRINIGYHFVCVTLLYGII